MTDDEFLKFRESFETCWPGQTASWRASSWGLIYDVAEKIPIGAVRWAWDRGVYSDPEKRYLKWVPQPLEVVSILREGQRELSEKFMTCERALLASASTDEVIEEMYLEYAFLLDITEPVQFDDQPVLVAQMQEYRQRRTGDDDD